MAQRDGDQVEEMDHQSSEVGRSVYDIMSSSLQAVQHEASQLAKCKNQSAGEPVASELEASLRLVRLNLQTAAKNVRDARQDTTKKGLNAGRLLELIETNLECLGKVMTRKGHLVSSPPIVSTAKDFQRCSN